MTAPSTPGPVLTITRRFPASPERVWRAWTDPAELALWFSPAPNVPLASAEMDARVGGAFRIALRAGPRLSVIRGRCLEVVPCSRLVLSWTWEPPHEFEGIDTRVTVELRNVGGETELTLTHEGLHDPLARSKHEAGHRGVLLSLLRRLTRPSHTTQDNTHEDR